MPQAKAWSNQVVRILPMCCIRPAHAVAMAHRGGSDVLSARALNRLPLASPRLASPSRSLP